MSFSEITRKIANSLIGVFSNEKKHKKAMFQPRRLQIDPLEERQLLSVNVVMPQEKMMTSFSEYSSPTISSKAFHIVSNNSYGGAQYLESYWSNDYMASNNQGDTVVVWSQNDFVFKMDRDGNYVEDKNGNRVLLTDSFGNAYDDYNVYAQYLTNQVERLTIPEELLADNIKGTNGSFQLVYSPYTVQRLSIKSITSTDGYMMMGTGMNIAMEFRLGGEDITGNGVADFTSSIVFNESQSPVVNARAIQNELRNLGGIYADITVTAESTTDFLITFGEAGRLKYGTNAVPELEVRDTRVIQGSFPGIVITTESAPIVLTTTDSWGNAQGILVEPGNPQLTAERIQQAFNSNARMSPFPRVETYSRDITLNPQRENVDYNPRPSYDVFYTSEVNVTYVGPLDPVATGYGTQFDITFVNSSGLSFQNIMLASAKDEWGTELVNTVAGMPSAEYTTTVKKSSDAFRVNSPEANDPYSSVPLVTNQVNASVAMDADGDFVISWQSEVIATGNTTISDIYARRFSPQGWVADESKISFFDDGYTTERYVGGVANNPVQGVRPVGGEFKVNSFSNGYATTPSIGMDYDGNFVIAWSTSYQKTTEGTAIYARIYDRYGTALTDSQVIHTDLQTPLITPTVAISNDGYIAVSWVNYEDVNTQHVGTVSSIYMSIFSPGTLTPIDPAWDAQLVVGGGTYSPNHPSLDFDSHNNLLFTYTDHSDMTSGTAKGSFGAEMSDVMARVYSLDTAAGTYTETQADFRVHAKGNWIDGAAYGEEYWRGSQTNGVGRFDSAGNMIFAYQGYGPDSNLAPQRNTYGDYGFNIPGSFFTQYINPYKNADLLKFFNPDAEDFVFSPYSYPMYGSSGIVEMFPYNDGIYSYSTSSSDVDMAIRSYVARAVREYPSITDDQIGRLNAIFQSVVGTMRGGANDVFVTRANKGDFNFLGVDLLAISSDANVTSTRDGVNSHWYILVPNYIENTISGGTINLALTTEFHVNAVDMPVIGLGLSMRNDVFQPTTFAGVIYRALNSLNDDGFFAANAFTNLLMPGVREDLGTVVMPSAEVFYYPPNEFEYLFGNFYDRMNGDSMYYYSSIMSYLDYGQSYSDMNGYHVYEIVFVGGAHDLEVSLYFDENTTITRNGDDVDDAYPTLFVEHYGYRGSEKGDPGLSVLPNGSYITSWFTNVTTTDGTVVDRKINYRYFQQNQDNVGPKVTDVVLPNGQYVANQQMVTYSLEHLVVTVDKELLANGVTGAHSVLNPSNWSIIKDGVRLNNVIKSISFGMNKAASIIGDNPNSIVADSHLAAGSNKWEVVIEFNEPLSNGNYQLVASNMLCDTTGVSYSGGRIVYNNGNALGSDGVNPNGGSFTRNFTITSMDGTLSLKGGSSGTEEKLVSTANGNHYTRTGDTANDSPGNPTSVASDQNGNFVTVWTAETTGGIMAMIYRQDFIDLGNGRESVITPIRELQVTNNPNATYASVAMDADGDFVVTWMQDDVDGRNIYAKAYNFNGSTRLDANGNPTSEFRVNTHTGKHNYPDIAMDLNGGFVITWESLNQVSRTSGYDIFFQRYDSSCTAIGGVDAIQAIQFNGNIAKDTLFDLRYIDEVANISIAIQDIKVGANLLETAQNIKAKLIAAGLEVETGVSNDAILIQFVGSYGARPIAPLIVTKLANPKPGQSIIVQSQTTGILSETRANDTTTGDKRYPSIAIASTGEVIITWTSWGQGNDNPYESNIYAKNFPSNDVVASMNRNVSLTERIDALSRVNRDVLKIVTTDDPNNHIVPPSEYTGVVMIWIADAAGNYMGHGSGTLLTSGLHILTAAHVTCDANGLPIPVTDLRVTFNLPSGPVTYGVSQNIVHWSYTGDAQRETDLAILVLSGIAPAAATRYDIYRDRDEVGSIFEVTGYGLTGTGVTGDIVNVPVPPAQGERRSGNNKYEATADIFDRYGYDYHPDSLVYDFDSGYTQNDAFGRYFGIYDTGLGYLEASSAHGDSGGPSFINGKIAGVVSWGSSIFNPSLSDIDIIPTNCTFGEFSVDVRVSSYADWIDTVVTSGTTEYLVNETETGNQIWSDVAISMSGEVVFTWTSFNQNGSGDGPGGSATDISGVFARRFTMSGTPVLGAVGVVAIDPTNPNGYDPGFDMTDPANLDPVTGMLIVPAGAVVFGQEFRVNDYIVGNQWYSSVSIANNGDFTITWESYQDKNTVLDKLPDTGHGVGGTTTETVTDFGVYAKRFTNLETLLKSLDNPGGAQYGLPDNARFIPGYGYVGMHGEIGTEFRVNTKAHLLGDQTGATVALNANGDAIIVFQSLEQSVSKVYYRAITLNVDRSAPIVTETVLVVNELDYDNNGNLIVDNNGDPVTKDGVLMPVCNDSVIYGYPTHIVVTFSEEMYNAYLYDPKSVLNPANWQLYRNGVSVFGGISDIQFGLDKAYFHNGFTLNSRTGKYEAVITFSQPLTSGNYSLVIRDSATDLEGNKLDGDYNGLAGGNFSRTFQVMVPTTEVDPGDPGDPDGPIPTDPDQKAFVNTEFGNDKPAIASSDDGSYVVVSVHYGTPGSPTESDDPLNPFDPTAWDPASDPIPRVGNIVMQRFNKDGNRIGAEQTVNTYMPGHQTNPDVAMDAAGNIAVVWSGAGSRSDNGIYLRLYDSTGKAVGDQIWVNDNYNAVCSTPKVAYDNHGNIVVTWVEYNATTRSQSIMARVYDSKGVQQSVALNSAASSKATMVLVAENNLSVTYTFSKETYAYDIAFAPDGELILTWQMHNIATNSQDIYAKTLKYTNTSSGAGTLVNKVNAFLVNQYTGLTQVRPSVAASATGFVITWASERQATLADSSLKSDTYDIYARRFNLNGVAQPILGTTGDCLINTQKVYSERMNVRDYPAVSMAPNGNFVITWSSYDQEPNNFDETARLPLHDYAAFARAFSSNGTNLKNGDYSGKDATGKDRFVDFMPNTTSNEFRLNFETVGNQMYSVASISAYGLSFAWVGAAEALLITEYDDLGQPVTSLPFTTIDVFTRAYSIGSRSSSSNQGQSSGFSTRSTYSPTQWDGGGGYVGQGANTYKYDNQTTLFLDGTNGNDVFEIIVSASGTFQVKVNGKSVTVGSQVKDIQIDGLGGNDKLTITNAAGDNTAKLNAEDGLVSFSTKNGTLTINALRTEIVELNVGGKNNSLQVAASAGDVLTVGFNDLSLAGGNHSYTAKGFGLVSAIATASSASAILYDSAGDDVLTMTPQKAVMKGQEFEHTVSGFGNITAYSTRGNNLATLYGSAGDDALFASGGSVALAGSGYKNTIFGFEKAFVFGNGGNDSATLVGSYAADRFTGTDSLMEAVFGRSSTVNINGFKNILLYGNGGNDVVALSNISQGSGLNANNTSATKTYLNTLANVTYTVIGINDVRGIQQQQSQAAAQASASAFSETIYEDDIYQLLAQEQNSKKTTENQDDELDIDYLLKIGAI